MILTLETIKRFNQRYTDTMEEHPNILAINLMKVKTTRRLERKSPQEADGTVIL